MSNLSKHDDIEYPFISKSIESPAINQAVARYLSRISKSIINNLEKYNLKSDLPTGKVITLCGSTRFRDLFLIWDRILTLAGNAVINIVYFEPDAEELRSKSIRKMLSVTHNMKIDSSDAIFIINPEHYIGQSTSTERGLCYIPRKNYNVFD